MKVRQIESLCQYDGEEQNGSIKLSDRVKHVSVIWNYSALEIIFWVRRSFLVVLSTVTTQLTVVFIPHFYKHPIVQFLSHLTVDDDDWNTTGNCGEFWGGFQATTRVVYSC